MDKAKKQEYDRQRYIKISEKKLTEKKPDKEALLSETDIAYLAGLIDGEGSLTIGITNKRFIPYISISMTNREVMDWIAYIFDTKTFEVKRIKTKPNWKKQYQVKFSGKRACFLVFRMLPYLKVKKRQGEIFVEFNKTYVKQGGPGILTDREIILKRFELKEKLHGLNDDRRGNRKFYDIDKLIEDYYKH